MLYYKLYTEPTQLYNHSFESLYTLPCHDYTCQIYLLICSCVLVLYDTLCVPQYSSTITTYVQYTLLLTTMQEQNKIYLIIVLDICLSNYLD